MTARQDASAVAHDTRDAGPLDHLAIVIGAMRCGTTSLFTWLAQHPEVCPCGDKEPAFFSNDDVWRRGTDWYRSLWDWDPSRHSIALEASTNYSKAAIFPRTAERIRATAPSARLVYVMRDPIDRLQSHYTLGRAKGWPESGKPLSEGVDPRLIECSRYATQIDQYRDYHEAGRLLLIRFEDLRDSPLPTLARVCEFCGIDSGFSFRYLDIPHNSNIGRRPGDVGQLLYRASRAVPFWRPLSRRIGPVQRDRIRRLFASRRADSPALSESQRDAVLAELADDMARLNTAYGVDTSGWSLP